MLGKKATFILDGVYAFTVYYGGNDPKEVRLYNSQQGRLSWNGKTSDGHTVAVGLTKSITSNFDFPGKPGTRNGSYDLNVYVDGIDANPSNVEESRNQ